MRSFGSSLATLLALGLLPIPPASAAPAPDAFSATFVSGTLGVPMTIVVRRNGTKALADSSYPPTPENAAGFHARNLYDLAAGTNFTLPTEPGATCRVERLSGDWGDPFAASDQVLELLAKASPKRLGTETVNGFATQIKEASDVAGMGPSRLWVDERQDLLIKWVTVPASGPQKVLWEVKSLTRTRPDASEFALPAACSSVVVPPSPEEVIAADTGGKPGDYLDAKLGPASSDRCHVLFKVVQKGTLQPVTSGFQVAVDTSIGPAGRPYSTDMDQDGHATFTGGSVHELTKQLKKDGSLRILNPPPNFLVSVNFPKGYDVDGPIFRKCFGPETTLLLLVDETKKPLHWLWVKTPH